ncbi:MAG: lysylphosphatidylglycerol synthase transmembrane domain-containing protein [Chitinophagaceae bacterium]
MHKKLRTIIQYLFFLGLGFFLVWLSVKDIDEAKWKEIRYALSHARYILIIPVFIILLGSHYVRALRWRLLMEPMGYKPDKTNTFFAVMIGYLANQGFPRLGEVLKCTLLARYEKIPADKLVGTIILERLIDAISLLIVFGITLVIQPGLYSRLAEEVFQSEPGKKDTSYSGLLTLIILAAIVIGVLLWMLIKRKNLSDLLQVFARIGQRIGQGLGTIRHLRKKGQFLFLTLLLWILYLSGGFIGFHALQETQQYGIREAFTVLSAGSIGMIITPGGIGGYALLIERTMMLYGLAQPIAAAFGWLLWLAQTSIILLAGLASFALLPWHNKRRTDTAS